MLNKYRYSFWQSNGKIDIIFNSANVGFASLLNGLYCLHMNTAPDLTPHAPINMAIGQKRERSDENSSMLWHRRLGHISRVRLERMIKQGILQNLDFSDFETCVDCIKGNFPLRLRLKGQIDLKIF